MAICDYLTAVVVKCFPLLLVENSGPRGVVSEAVAGGALCTAHWVGLAGTADLRTTATEDDAKAFLPPWQG